MGWGAWYSVRFRGDPWELISSLSDCREICAHISPTGPFSPWRQLACVPWEGRWVTLKQAWCQQGGGTQKAMQNHAGYSGVASRGLHLEPESPGKVFGILFKDGYRIYFRAVRVWGDPLPKNLFTHASHAHFAICIVSRSWQTLGKNGYF